MTYLQLVNSVLARLRESSVATVSSTSYSTLIGKFVNDSKRQVEDSFNWDALRTTLTITTVSGTSTYTVTGSGKFPKGIAVNDTTNQGKLLNVPIQWILNQQQLTTTSNAIPSYYAWNGTDGTDSKVELFPTPNGTFSLKFNLYVPQANLSADSDVLTIPAAEAVEMGAYARALVERGEDGGLNSSEAYALFKSILNDQISLESTRFSENDEWVAV